MLSRSMLERARVVVSASRAARAHGAARARVAKFSRGCLGGSHGETERPAKRVRLDRSPFNSALRHRYREDRNE
jgi:hypothetical protein